MDERKGGHIRSRWRLRELGAIECCGVVSMRAEKFSFLLVCA